MAVEANPQEAITAEVKRRNFVRAVMLAQQYHYPQDEVRHLQELALKQIAAEYRNALALRRLASEWGFSRAELEAVLREVVAEHRARPGRSDLERRYDATTGKYLTLPEWVERVLNMKDGHRALMKL